MRADVEPASVRQTELRTGHSRYIRPYISSPQPRQAQQPFAVMALAVIGLHVCASEIAVDRAAAGGFRMSPGDALDGGEAQRGQRRVASIHSELWIYEHIER